MTEHQARATEPSLTAWVGASAGTGKTHVLTARVLRLMLTGTPPEKLLCLTFTKAAAAEMKARIFRELGGWAVMTDDALIAAIGQRTGEYADDSMLARARQLFAHVLDLTAGLQIQTFHSFCQSLLGRFPLEADLSPGFEGMEESAAAEVMAEARDGTLAKTRLSGGERLKTALDTVAGLVTENTFDEVIGRLSFEMPRLGAVHSHFNGDMEAIRRALYRALGLEPDETPDSVRAGACAAGVFDDAGLAGLAGALASGSPADRKRGQAVAAFLEDHGRAAAFRAFEQVFLTADGGPRKRVATKAVLTGAPALDDVITATQERLASLRERAAKARAAAATAALLHLGFAQLAEYRRVKEARGLIDFDDMISHTLGLLDRPGIAPWILFKLDHGLDHILVDEAQDTNRAQWQVVEALAAEFYAGEGARDMARTVFAVGDAKQSIFSFQRADPREFLAARDRVFARARAADMVADDVPLSLSFRSSGAVMGLVDAVFADGAPAADGVALDGVPVRHDFHRSGDGGLVELWPLEEAAAPAEADGWRPPTVQETAADAQERAAWRLARRIRAMVRGGDMLVSKGRAIQPGDILVLVRRRTAFVDHLVKAFKSLNLPVAGRDRMMLRDELAVMDTLAALRFVLQPGDDLSLAALLKSPFIGLDEDALFSLAHRRGGSLWDALCARAAACGTAGVDDGMTGADGGVDNGADDGPALGTARRMLGDLLSAADRMTPFEFLSHVLVVHHGRDRLARRLGSDVHDPLDELLAAALDFERVHAPSLEGFLAHMDRSESQIKRDLEAGGGAIRIMTVHSAKGLQAPVVFLGDCASVPDGVRDSRLVPLELGEGAPDLLLWTSPAKDLPLVKDKKAMIGARLIAEYRRLLYVALTRAEDRLYALGWRGREPLSDKSWYHALEAGFARLEGETVTGPDGLRVRRFSVAQRRRVTPPGPEAPLAATAARPLWYDAPPPAEPTPPRPLAPSRPDDEEPAVLSPLSRGGKPFRRGRLVHSMLEFLPDLPAAQRAEAARRYLALPAHKLSGDEQAALAAEVLAILAHPEFAGLFGPGSRAEAPIAGVIGNRVISGQVDRLVIGEDTVLIVDYKTNRPPPRSAADVGAVYIKQMALYAAALRTIYPGRRVRAALLWTETPVLMPLPEDRLSAALDAMGL
ncbi:DNA helicase/exodeoxyribonuclease V subunit A [Eilatimonas milleporae]|uniref:DNA 3'-5' helicase n=2 Tax=Eilatimonas milleporae TaxID=911205 RepID=A0A3M0C2A6_9PROT|nr:DNA helicase/exodeoxyribonuclease V subunit A [Eilatimonas milleporae]